ncbi:major capsid protein [Rhodococcus sp. USK10]|uniref:major capsid protein n=1 Tax=Rhodococcus sp. USK10 TaxID=2789739 RepID=UPI001C5FF747|nr:major capsid protein [Rhodococcus sp. USK10]QYB01470.1 major capsid protein [Rhodococcus sp. USK10]
MAIFFDAPVSPDALITFVRRVPTPSDNALSRLFPTITSDKNTVDFAEIVQKNRTAKYRSPDGAIHVSERDVGSEIRVPLATLSDSLGLGEYERLQMEFARTGGTFKERLVEAVYDDAENLTRYVLNRVELAWGDVLADGKLTINEGNGFEGEADYGMPENHAVAPAGAAWTNTTTAVPLTDLLAWSDVWNATNGSRPAKFLTGLKNLRLLQKNKEIIDAVHGATQGRTRVTLTELTDLLASEGLPTPLAPYDTQLSVDNVNTRVYPESKVSFLPENLEDLGHMRYGLTATALELLEAQKTEYSFSEAPGIVGVVVKGGEPAFRKHTYVDAVGQPVLTDAKKLMVAVVS